MAKTLDQISPDLSEDLELLFKSFEMEVIRAISDFERITKSVICSNLEIIRRSDAGAIAKINYSIKRKL